jgi:hypothetical protein
MGTNRALRSRLALPCRHSVDGATANLTKCRRNPPVALREDGSRRDTVAESTPVLDMNSMYEISIRLAAA